MDEPDEPQTSELLGWSRRVTIVVSYDPETETVVVDAGDLPKLFAKAVLAKLDDDFLFADEVLAAAGAEDDDD